MIQSNFQRLDSTCVLLTGATGLLGRYLLRDLIKAGKQVAVVSRGTSKLSARERIESIMQWWEIRAGKQLPRPIVIEGDLCQNNLGIADSDLQWIRTHCDTVLHNAAILKFETCETTNEPFRTNVSGTLNVLELAANCDIQHFHYVSTAYVCGQADGVVKESELDFTAHRNAYEHSKFQAEKLVRSAKGFDSTTVYRPGIIIGDSQSGYSSAYHGLLAYLRLIALLVPMQQKNENGEHKTPIRLPMNGDEPRNLVPVDWVSAVITHGVETPAAHGETYHLTPKKCATVKHFIESCCRYFNSSGVVFAGPDAKPDMSNDFSRAISESTRVYESYLPADPLFDRENVETRIGHLHCPEVDEAMIHRFIQYGQENRWGKSRPKKPAVPYWFEDHLDEFSALAESVLVRLRVKPLSHVLVGLKIVGPGGGQWILSGSRNDIRIQRGTPAQPAPILTLNNDQVTSIFDQLKSRDHSLDKSPEFESAISVALNLDMGLPISSTTGSNK